MFQRLKGALDQALAEEPERPLPSSSRPQRTSRAPRQSNDSPSRRPLRPAPKPLDQSRSVPTGPDPSPAIFESDSVVNDGGDTPNSDDKINPTATPERSQSPDRDNDSAEPSNLKSDSSANVEINDDVRAKLRRLSKIEAKYQELLRAYRKAHARNSAIEPFEARLREVTPLTSIGEPDALVEYIKQISVKGEMAVEELRKMAKEKDDLKQALAAAETETRKAWDEVAQLKEQSAAKLEAKEGETEGEKSSSMVQIGELKDELQRKTSQITELEAQISRQDVKAEPNKALSESLDGDNGTTDGSQAVEDLQSKLALAEREIEEHKSKLREQEGLSGSLQTQIDELQSKLTTSSKEADAPEDDGEGPKPSTGLSLPSTEAAATTSSKKNKKKKKKGNASANEQKPDSSSGKAAASTEIPTKGSDLGSESTDNIQKTLEDKEARISQLNAKLKDQADMAEEIESLRDELVLVGQEHVETKEALKTAVLERDDLKSQVAALRDQATSNDPRTNDQVHADKSALEGLNQDLTRKLTGLQQDHAEELSKAESKHSSLEADVERLTGRVSTLQTDLNAAQQLAASRFRDLSELRERYQKMQSELSSLRSEATDLKASKRELSSKIADISRLEAREGELRAQISTLRKDIVEREGELRTARQKQSEETTQRENAEESYHRVQRALQRAQKEKADAQSAKENTAKSLQQAQASLEKHKEYEERIQELTRSNESLRDDIAMKTAQYASTQSLMTSLQDQSTEIAAQNKETKERCESLEDELAEVSRQRDGRSREAETMRRLLADVEGRADSRIKAMQERLESANEERDRAEDEASTFGRRRAKEVEELKNRLRDAERDLKEALDNRTNLDKMRQQLQEDNEEREARVAKITGELEEAKNAMANLRSILEGNELQIKSLEQEKTEAKVALEEAQARAEKQHRTNKALTEDLRSLRAAPRIRASDSPQPSSRSSFESASQLGRVASPSSTEKGGTGGSGAVDFVYLKNILLQFVEQKDRKHQMSLIPVLAMLLRFDKNDEQKWLNALAVR